MPPLTPRILVFDSGVGGLSILAEVQRLLPDACYTYLADNAAFPYGIKTEQALIERVDRVLHQALLAFPADLMIVACNSASTIALPQIRNRFSLPVIGVVPAIKPAASITRSGVIGVLATPGTVTRQYTRDLIAQFAPDRNVILHGSAELVELAECKLRGLPVPPAQLAAALQPLFGHASGGLIDTVVLACTHFPLLTAEMRAQAPAAIHWIDSGEAIARRARYLVNHLQLSAAPVVNRAVFTRLDSDTELLLPALRRYQLPSSELLTVTDCRTGNHARDGAQSHLF